MKNQKSNSIPALNEIDPVYAEYEKKKHELSDEIGKTQKQIDAVHANLRKTNKSPRQSERDARIARLTGDAVADVIDDGRNSLPALMQKVSDLQAAVRVMETKLVNQRMIASKVIREQVGPEYARRVAAICKAMIELNGAVGTYEQLVHELQNQDVAWTALRPMQPQFIGNSRDKQGRIAQYLREAAQFGFIEKSSIPPELK